MTYDRPTRLYKRTATLLNFSRICKRADSALMAPSLISSMSSERLYSPVDGGATIQTVINTVDDIAHVSPAANYDRFDAFEA